MSIDRIGNMLSSIRNASMVGKPSIELPYTKETENIAKVLKAEGFLSDVRVFKHKDSKHKGLALDLLAEMKISKARRVSKPGRRRYISSRAIKPVAGGLGVAIVSTSRGVMSGTEAQKKKLGGEIICEVY